MGDYLRAYNDKIGVIVDLHERLRKASPGNGLLSLITIKENKMFNFNSEFKTRYFSHRGHGEHEVEDATYAMTRYEFDLRAALEVAGDLR